MSHRPFHSISKLIDRFLLLASLASTLLLVGCAADNPTAPSRNAVGSAGHASLRRDAHLQSTARERAAALDSLPDAPPPSPQPAPDQPVALIYSVPIDHHQFWAALAEFSGGVILEELLLDAELKRELDAQSLSLPPGAVNDEERLLAATLAQAAGLAHNHTPDLIDQVKRSRGLGPIRFQNLLERNAMLRALVRAEASPALAVSDSDLQRAYQIRFGPRVRARLILVRTLEKAQHILAALRASPDSGLLFAQHAAKDSVDPTSARSGLLDQIPLADPNYPAAVMQALAALKPGDISDPIAVSWPLPPTPANPQPSAEQGYAILRLEERFDAKSDVPFESVRPDLQREIVMVRERAAMDRIAQTLLERAARFTTVLDKSVDWSWRSRTVR